MSKIDKNKKIVFIDMDDTIITTSGRNTFPKGIWDVKFIIKTLDALKEWVQEGNINGIPRYIFIVSNQGGIEKKRGSKEIYIIQKLQYVRACIEEYVGGQGTGVIVDFSYCPYADSSHQCRKPNTGMLELMLKDVEDISKDEMIMIGDASGKPGDFSDSDLRCAENFGISYLDIDEI